MGLPVNLLPLQIDAQSRAVRTYTAEATGQVPPVLRSTPCTLFCTMYMDAALRIPATTRNKLLPRGVPVTRLLGLSGVGSFLATKL